MARVPVSSPFYLFSRGGSQIVVSLSTNILHHLPANRENKGKYLQYFVLTNNLEIVYQFLDFSYPYQVNVAAKRAFSCEKRLKE